MSTLVLKSADGRGAIRPLDAPPGTPAWAAVDERFNALAPEGLPALPSGGRLVLWSGWTGATADDPDAHPTPAWGRSSHTAFEAWCDRVAPDLASADAKVLFRPHARHVLSDAPSCLSFLRSRTGAGFGLLLDPCAMLDATMLGRAEDHLPRIFDALARQPAVEAILLTNVRAVPEAPGELRPAPLHEGLLPSPLIASAYRNHGSSALPLVLLDTQVAQQRAVLDAV